MVLWFGVVFYKQKTAYEMRISDWSSDVCSSDLFAARQHPLGGGVQVGAELGERGHFPVLGQLALDRPGRGLHRLDLSRGSHPADADADVHRRADALEDRKGVV